MSAYNQQNINKDFKRKRIKKLYNSYALVEKVKGD
jgi:hypothetical protein